MTSLQVDIDERTKSRADTLFASLGMDTSTAVRIFIVSALKSNGIPFDAAQDSLSPSLMQAVDDTRNRVNLHGPFCTAEAAVASMLED